MNLEDPGLALHSLSYFFNKLSHTQYSNDHIIFAHKKKPVAKQHFGVYFQQYLEQNKVFSARASLLGQIKLRKSSFNFLTIFFSFYFINCSCIHFFKRNEIPLFQQLTLISQQFISQVLMSIQNSSGPTESIPNNSEQIPKISPIPNSMIRILPNEMQQQVIIYLRQTNKRTHKIQVPTVLEVGRLFEYVHEFCKLEHFQQILFYRGKMIDPHKPQLLMRFTNGSIVHIGKKESLCNYDQQIVVNFECYHKGTKIKSNKLATNSNQKMFVTLRTLKVIGESYQINDDSVQVYQHGRKINTSNSFYEQQIERKSYLIVIVHVINSLDNQQEENIQSQQNNIPMINIRYEGTPENQDDEPRKDFLEVKSIQCRDEVENIPSPNFKKQNKTSHLYKTTRCPFDMGAQKWQSDSSSEFVKKQRIKAILIKKDSRNKDQNIYFDEQTERVMKLSNSSDNSGSFGKFSIFDKMQLKSDIRKLFQSQRFIPETEVKKLEPPKIMTDEFLDEIEEMQIDDIQLNHPHTNTENGMTNLTKINLAKPQYLNSNLQKSLGVPRKRQWHAVMIPTHDNDIQEDDDESDDQNFEDF